MDKMEIIGISLFNLQIQVRMGYVYKLLGYGLTVVMFNVFVLV